MQLDVVHALQERKVLGVAIPFVDARVCQQSEKMEEEGGCRGTHERTHARTRTHTHARLQLRTKHAHAYTLPSLSRCVFGLGSKGVVRFGHQTAGFRGEGRKEGSVMRVSANA